jgi:hypothetical protein
MDEAEKAFKHALKLNPGTRESVADWLLAIEQQRQRE